MNPEQQKSYIRSTLLILIGGALAGAVTKGYISQDDATQIATGLAALVMAGGAVALAHWGSISHSPASVVAAVNSASVPGVKAVSADSPSPQVAVTPAGVVHVDPTAIAPKQPEKPLAIVGQGPGTA